MEFRDNFIVAIVYDNLAFLIFSGTLLESLLSIEATKSSSYPTIEGLLCHPFFTNAIDSLPKDFTKAYLKFSAYAKEALVKHKDSYERRLLEGHKKFKLQEKEKKRIGIMSDESKRKKRQQKNFEGLGDESITIQSPLPTPTPAPLAPPPPPPTAPPPVPVSQQTGSSGTARTALLGSIASFNKNGLKKAVTVDKSKPKV